MVNSQQLLVQGMLSRENLLDILHSYIVFAEDSKGNPIKLVPRYQQYRTSRKIVERLKSKQTNAERGGIVWRRHGQRVRRHQEVVAAGPAGHGRRMRRSNSSCRATPVSGK